MKLIAATALLAAISAPATAQSGAAVLPADTVITVAAVDTISSKKMHEGDVERLQVTQDVLQNGVVVIPRGAPVKATVTWRTGKGIGGKSAKFELTFNTVTVRGQDYRLKGTVRKDGRGNTVGALLGSMIITGKSAELPSGEPVNAFTAEPIPVS